MVAMALSIAASSSSEAITWVQVKETVSAGGVARAGVVVERGDHLVRVRVRVRVRV